MAARTLRLGTRRSPLALAQSQQVAAELEARHPGLAVKLVPIITRGDRFLGDLKQVGGKGLFTEELEAGLADGSLDFAVHSLKDLPVTLPAGLVVAAYPERADPRDVLVSEVAADLDALPPGAVLLTGSDRRRSQILNRRADLVVEGLRGNVGTRLERWRESGHAGVILAAAGLARLGLTRPGLTRPGLTRPGLHDLPAHPLAPEALLPAPGQGILALEVREGGRAEHYCRALDHPPSARAAAAERAVVAAFGGDCTLPLAAWAREEGVGLRLAALLATPDGHRVCRGEGEGPDPGSAAAACLEAMRGDGSESLLAALRR